MTSAEARLDMLEDTEDQRRNSPPALASEVEMLNAKLEDRDSPIQARGSTENFRGKEHMRNVARDGGIAIAKIRLDGQNIALISAYAPNTLEAGFYDLLTKTLRDLTGFHLVMGADFNARRYGGPISQIWIQSLIGMKSVARFWEMVASNLLAIFETNVPHSPVTLILNDLSNLGDTVMLCMDSCYGTAGGHHHATHVSVSLHRPLE
ncbi:hypothetical protein NQZ68_026308 [Dissostichus eleginoides]|nr:hypothetical protein NQZ68_026308 [Dissostichus eleginoides]